MSATERETLKFLSVRPISSCTVHVDAASALSSVSITDLAVFIHTLQPLNERKVVPAPIPTSFQSACTVVIESLHQFLMAASCHPRPFELSGKGKTWTTILRSLMGHCHQLIHRQHRLAPTDLTLKYSSHAKYDCKIQQVVF